MNRLLHQRVAPALLIAQIAYIVLLELLFGLSGPDTAELDHTAPSPTGDALFTGLLILTVLAMGGGAALLGWKRVQAWAPPTARAAWLGALGLGEIALAAAFLNEALRQSLGPDTLIAALAIVVSLAITLTCVGEVQRHLRSLRPATQG
ncbi:MULTISPECIES: hypothetical protein [unclassified Streptomyces]|uniref:hypothetical protein n=1 Tax=Streptomyces sp. NPDC055082 TaxID=3365718 RepID=UPI0037D75DB1